MDKEKRSAVMVKIRSKDTKPELTVRRHLCHRGCRYRKNVKGLPDTPEIAPRKKAVKPYEMVENPPASRLRERRSMENEILFVLLHVNNWKYNE